MKQLIIITGPTASGKSRLALDLAGKLDTVIISADSRQIYRDIPIGTAAPSLEDMVAVPHFFVGSKNIDEYYSAWEFEKEAIEVIKTQFRVKDTVIACGGSMLYVKALKEGLDDIPSISSQTRLYYERKFKDEGLESLLIELREEDPEYFDIVDRQNHKRVIHALEIIKESGKTYTSLRKGQRRQRDFDIKVIAPSFPRDILYDRINRRVDTMIEQGLIEEAERVYDKRHYNSLNTVGYKELFMYFDGLLDKATAIEKIKRNTRVFAKKQLTWLRSMPEVTYVDGELSHEEQTAFVMANIL